MKIAFWSTDNDKCNVTANLAAISVASVLLDQSSVVITFENQLNDLNLGKAYQGIPFTASLNEVGTNYYDGGGIEGLLRKIYRGDNPTPDVFHVHLREIIQNHLYYIPQSRIIHSDLFEYEFSYCLQNIFDLIDNNSDICFIDTASSNNLSTKTILDRSDLIVVNLCQDIKILEEFFLNYSSLISKSVFIISDFDFHSTLTLKKIAHLYQIPLDDILRIPSNLSYQLAFEGGSVVEFIQTNYKVLKDNPNYMFIKLIQKAAVTINKKILHLKKEKEFALLD